MPIRNVSVTMSFLKKQLGEATSNSILATVTRMKDELVLATPVDTGNARESWEVARDRTKKNPTFIVSNNTEYIGALNEGHSDQAPAHFIEAIALRYGSPKGQVVTYRDE